MRVHVNQLNIDEQESVESFEIVWFEERSKEALLQDSNYLEQILFLEEFNFRFFSDRKECTDYLCGLTTNVKALLVVNEQQTKNIIDTVHHLCPIKFIFVIYPEGIDINNQNNLLPEYLKVRIFRNSVAFITVMCVGQTR